MHRILWLVMTGVFLFGSSLSAAQAQGQAEDTLQHQQQIYGWQLMNEQERHEYQNRMREMKTAEEREVYRNQHHEMMQERARQQGLKLPDSPGTYGKGMGSGSKKKGGNR